MKISERIALRDLIQHALHVFGTDEVLRVSGYAVEEINRFMNGYGLNDRVAKDFYDTLCKLGSIACTASIDAEVAV